jgi:hypothetical protein
MLGCFASVAGAVSGKTARAKIDQSGFMFPRVFDFLH